MGLLLHRRVTRLPKEPTPTTWTSSDNPNVMFFCGGRDET